MIVLHAEEVLYNADVAAKDSAVCALTTLGGLAIIFDPSEFVCFGGCPAHENRYVCLGLNDDFADFSEAAVGLL